jgi:hypothetical protein
MAFRCFVEWPEEVVMQQVQNNLDGRKKVSFGVEEMIGAVCKMGGSLRKAVVNARDHQLG